MSGERQWAVMCVDSEWRDVTDDESAAEVHVVPVEEGHRPVDCQCQPEPDRDITLRKPLFKHRILTN